MGFTLLSCQDTAARYTNTLRAQVQSWIFLWARSSPELGPRLAPDLFNAAVTHVL